MPTLSTTLRSWTRLRPSLGILGIPAGLIACFVLLGLTLRDESALRVAIVHAQTAHNQLQRVLTLLVDSETGQRGYLLTGAREFLEPHEKATAQLPGALSELERVYRDDPATEADLHTAQALIRHKLEISRTAIRSKAEPQAPAEVLARERAGKQAMDQIRTVISRIELRQESAMRLRSAQARRARGRVEGLFAVVALALFGLLGRSALQVRSAVAEQRKRSDAAESAARAKSDFLANMSHELRTPLNAVVGYSRMLLESPDLAPEDRRRAEIVAGAGEALGVLINDVLDFSKLEAGAVELEPLPFAVDDLVSEALSLVEPKAAENRVRLSAEGEAGGVLIGDRHRLRQVLLNFLSNAVKFTHDGAVRVQVATTAAGERVSLRIGVADEGVGIEPDKLDGLFTRFSQVDSSVSRTFGGTGLGLAISRELIELMGGRVGVSSTPGQGSTFFFEVELPRGVLQRPAQKLARGRAQFPGRRVLVVDDVALNRELVQEMLRRHGCAADLAGDGAEALAALRLQPYDLVLMDVHMPVMDGLQATRAVRARGEATPIYALTASSAPDRVQTCLAAGMNGHLLKPLAPEALEQALIRVFGAPTSAAPPAAATAAASPSAPSSGGGAAQRHFETTVGAVTALRLVKMFEVHLASSFKVDDPAQLQAEAHRIAGSAGMLGLTALGAAAKALEEACRQDGEVGEPLARARAASAEATAEITAWIQRLEVASAAPSPAVVD